MELRCCICNQEFIGYGNNAEPVKKGICCNSCNVKFTVPSRILLQKISSANFEIIRTSKELDRITQKLAEKNFEQVAQVSWMDVYKNPETEENTVVCIL